MFTVICIFEAPDGEHVGHFHVDVPSKTVPDAVLAQHATNHYGQREHIRLLKWWRSRSPMDLAETIAANKAKYPNRDSLEDLTGGQPTRALQDPTIFEKPGEEYDTEDAPTPMAPAAPATPAAPANS